MTVPHNYGTEYRRLSRKKWQSALVTISTKRLSLKSRLLCDLARKYTSCGDIREVTISRQQRERYENDNDISLSFSLRFCKQRNERLVAFISSFTTTITNMNQGRTQEMMISVHTNFVLVLAVVVKS